MPETMSGEILPFITSSLNDVQSDDGSDLKFHQQDQEEKHHGSPPPTRKRRSADLPDDDAEVIALSPETLMATKQYFCEVCEKGFTREQNLQLHRRSHKLSWDLRKGSPDDRARKRVYVCPDERCARSDASRALGDLSGIKKHYRRKHGRRAWACSGCSRAYAVLADYKQHAKTCGQREFVCDDCAMKFSRRDSYNAHKANCEILKALKESGGGGGGGPPNAYNQTLGVETQLQVASGGKYDHHLASYSTNYVPSKQPMTNPPYLQFDSLHLNNYYGLLGQNQEETIHLLSHGGDANFAPMSFTGYSDLSTEPPMTGQVAGSSSAMTPVNMWCSALEAHGLPAATEKGEHSISLPCQQILVADQNKPYDNYLQQNWTDSNALVAGGLGRHNIMESNILGNAGMTMGGLTSDVGVQYHAPVSSSEEVNISGTDAWAGYWG